MTTVSLVTRVLSYDPPRSRIVSWAVATLLIAMVVAPLAGAPESMNNAFARLAVFVLLATSFDLLLGYTGLISFAHTMFFGIGAYSVALSARYLGPTGVAIVIGALAGLVLAIALAAVVGASSARVRAIFFAMITLAVSSVFSIVVTQYYEITGGQDGMNFRLPRELGPVVLFQMDKPAISVFGSTIVYYLILLVAVLSFLAMLRLVNSPFGRALESIRENEFRAEAIGINVLKFRIAINCISAAFACVAGSLFALWVRYVSPETTMGNQVMLDILLMTVIGGMGTLYGPVIGAAVFIAAETYLKSAVGAVAPAFADIPVLSAVTNPDRWIFWLGLMFVICVYYFPDGIVGRLRRKKANER